MQFLVFDTRRGNREGQEDDKVLAGFPSSVPLVQQSGMAGLLQGLLLFTASFTAAERPHWDVAETDSGTWVMHEAEPHIWFAALAPWTWIPRHATEHNLRAVLSQMHLLVTVLCGSVQSMLEQDPGGSLARINLQAVLQQMGQQLSSPHTWQHRELRNPLMDASLPPLLQLPATAALGVQSLSNLLLQASVQGRRPVQGLMLLYGPHLLHSTLAPRDTAAVFALLATGLLHASSSSSAAGNSSSTNGSGGSARMSLSDMRPLDGKSWQQLPSGYLVLRGSLDAAITESGAPAVTIPLVHLHQELQLNSQQQQQQSPQQPYSPGCSRRPRQQQRQQQGAASEMQQYHLLPLLEGRLLVVMLLGAGTQLTSPLLEGLHGWAAAPAKQLAAQIGEEIKATRTDAAHLPGFRYLFEDQQQQVVRASPRVKVSAMSHHARALVAAVRHSLGKLPEAGEQQGAACTAAGAGQQQQGEPGCEGPGGQGSPSAPDGGWAQPGPRRQSSADSSSSGGGGSSQDHVVLEVLAKSSQDCWAAAWRQGGGGSGGGEEGRQLLAVRERRSEKELVEAGEVMAAFAAHNFLM